MLHFLNVNQMPTAQPPTQGYSVRALPSAYIGFPPSWSVNLTPLSSPHRAGYRTLSSPAICQNHSASSNFLFLYVSENPFQSANLSFSPPLIVPPQGSKLKDLGENGEITRKKILKRPHKVEFIFPLIFGFGGI